MRIRGLAVSMLAGLVLGGVVRAAPPSEGEVADQVLAAFAGHDGGALRELAARDAPDPWQVADELCARGAQDAAQAFATAARRPDTAKLAAYVAARGRHPDDERRREAVLRAGLAIRKGDWTGLLSAVEGDAGKDDVLAARILCGRASALGRLNRPAESALVWWRAAETADRIGWLARAEQAYLAAAITAGRAGDAALEGRALAGLTKVAETRENHARLVQFARLLAKRGSSREALALERSVIAILERNESRDGLFDAYLRAGDLEFQLDEVDAARRSYERALAAAGADPAGRVDAQLKIAVVLRRQGRDREVLARLEPLIAIAQGPLAVGCVCRSIGQSHQQLGEYGAALQSYGRALRLFREAGARRLIASTLNSLGNVRNNVGDFAGSIPYFEEAMAMAREDRDLPREMRYATNQALAHYRLGQYETAAALQERILHYRQREKTNRADLAIALVNLSLTNAALGNLDTAIRQQREALVLHEQLDNPRGVAVAYGNLGEFEAMRGNHAEAVDLLEKGARLAEEIGDRWHQTYNLLRLATQRLARGQARDAVAAARRGVEAAAVMMGGLDDESGAMAGDRWSGIFAVGARAAIRLDDPAELLFFLESGRASALVESLGGRDALRAVALPAELRELENGARAAEAVAVARYRAARGRGGRAALKAARSELDAAQARVQEAVERIQREAKAAAAIVYARPVTLDALQARLGAGETFVAYLLLPEASALVVTRTAARIVPLGPTEAVIAACRSLSVADPQADPAAGLKRLRALVLAPLELAPSTRRLLVSTHRDLNLVPFAALAGDREVLHVPSATTYDLLRGERARRGRGVLAVGDPEYAEERHLAPLPASRAEATAVGDLVLLGADATETRFLAEASRAQRWRAVHFAGHGLLNSREPAFSALAFAADETRDGLLDTLEVMGAWVNADLAVLSACDTARGRVYRGEGVLGFARAFMLAGTPRVITSLWRVDDEATAALMTKFYELWNPEEPTRSLPAATALKRAQEHVAAQERWRHPYYWSAWQLWGLPD